MESRERVLAAIDRREPDVILDGGPMGRTKLVDAPIHHLPPEVLPHGRVKSQVGPTECGSLTGR